MPRNNPQLSVDGFKVEQLAVAANRIFPARIAADWRRFSCGLWRIPEGDIWTAYSGQTFPVIKAFRDGNVLYTNGGAIYSDNPIKSSVDGYPILSMDFDPRPEPKEYSYEGREAKLHGKSVLLGPKVIFESTEPTVSEWRNLLRILYVDGGYFASQNTYGEFLAQYQNHDGDLSQAVALEKGHEFRELTKERLSAFLNAEPRKQSIDQLVFPL